MGQTRFNIVQADQFLGSQADASPYGKIWYVDGTNGSDGNIGDAPDAAFASIGAAISAAVATRGDTVVIYPGTYTITTVLAAKAGMTFKAAVIAQQTPTVIVTGNIASLVTVDVNNCRFQGIEFKASGSTVTKMVNVASAASVRALLFEDCVFNGADQTNAEGLVADHATNTTTGLIIRRCLFRDIAVLCQLEVGVQGAPYGKIEDNVFAVDVNSGTGIGLADTGAVATGKGLVIKNNDFTGFDTTGDEVGITISGAAEDSNAGVMIRGNFFALFAAAAISANKVTRSMINNYVGDTGTGGTLVDAGN